MANPTTAVVTKYTIGVSPSGVTVPLHPRIRYALWHTGKTVGGGDDTAPVFVRNNGGSAVESYAAGPQSPLYAGMTLPIGKGADSCHLICPSGTAPSVVFIPHDETIKDVP